MHDSGFIKVPKLTRSRGLNQALRAFLVPRIWYDEAMMDLRRLRILYAAFAGMTLAACSYDFGGNSLITQSVEPPGDNCPTGGIRVDTGIDSNGDGELSDDEIGATSYLCNGEQGDQGNTGATGAAGEDGHNSLVNIVDATTDQCPAGGKVIETGLDNGDGDGIADNDILEPGEVDETELVCNGLDGEACSATSNGDGTFTVDCPNAEPIIVTNLGYAVNSLVEVSEASTEDCPHGGKTIRTGLDDGSGAGNPNDGVLHRRSR